MENCHTKGENHCPINIRGNKSPESGIGSRKLLLIVSSVLTEDGLCARETFLEI